MTIEQAKQKLVALAKSQVGYHEGANNYNKYADDPLIAKLYGWSPQNTYWCCTFTNWCYLTAFGYDIGSRLTYGGTAACESSAQLFKDNNAWVTFPNVGDVAFYYANGKIGHEGIVVAIDGTQFAAIEGNYSDKVSEVKHNIGRSDVAGFGRPNWKLVEGLKDTGDTDAGDSGQSGQKPAEPKPTEPSHKLIPPLIRIGSVNDAVSLAQSALNLRNYDCGKVDREFGPKTQNAVYRFQKDFGLVQDGIVGNATWTVLLERR